MIERVCSLLKMMVPERNRGYLFASGTTVPTDGDDGYQTGCIFQQTDGGEETALYVNEGSVTSCNFNAVKSPDTMELFDLSDVGTLDYSAGNLLVGDGDSYESVAVSGPFNLTAAGLLSMDSATVAAAGSVQGDAAELADGFSLVTAADGTKGVILPAAAAGGLCVVKNNSASTLKVYPNASDKIDDGSADAAVVVDAYATALFVAYDDTDWYSHGRRAVSYATLTHTVALVDLRQEDAVKDVLPDTPDGDGGTLGLADAAGSPVVGTTTNNTSATEKCSFDFVVPPDYVAQQDITVRVNGLVSVARNDESLLDVVCKHVKSGDLDATDLCTTAAVDMKNVTAATDEDFTIDGDAADDEISPGDVLHVEISFETDDTGGGDDGYAQINTVQCLVPCYK